MRNELKISLLLLAFSVNAYSQADTTTVEDKDAGKKEAVITLQMGANDTMYIATAILKDAATNLPVQDVEIVFYVQRTFGLMNVGDGITDMTGTVSVEFPLDTRPGGKNQLLKVLAKVEDDDNIRSISAQAEVKSEIPFPSDKPVPRALIGAKAPWWLIISFFGTVGAIYGLFLYVFILIYKIKKASNHSLIIK